MKKLISSMLILMCSACTQTRITGPLGEKVAFNNFGSHTQFTSMAVGAISIQGWNDNAVPGLQTVAETIRKMFLNYLTTEGMKFVAGKYYDQEGKVVDSAKSIKLEELRNAKTATQGEQALEALKIETAVMP